MPNRVIPKQLTVVIHTTGGYGEPNEIGCYYCRGGIDQDDLILLQCGMVAPGKGRQTYHIVHHSCWEAREEIGRSQIGQRAVSMKL